MGAHRPAVPDRPRRSTVARAVRLVGGWSLLLVGAALLVLPGPGIPLVLAGLALVGREQGWARRLTERMQARWRAVRARATAGDRPPAPMP